MKVFYILNEQDVRVLIGGFMTVKNYWGLADGVVDRKANNYFMY